MDDQNPPHEGTYSETALTKGQLIDLAPMILVDQMRKSGFAPFFATKMRSKLRPQHTKIMLKFRHELFLNSIANKEEGFAPEIVMVKTHDETSSCSLYLGIYRAPSVIGSIAGSSFPAVEVPQSRVPEIVEQSKVLITGSARIVERVHEMQKRTLSLEESVSFAENAAAIKSGHAKDIRFNSADLLRPYRETDKARDLWTIFNVVLENLLKGRIPETALASGPDAAIKPIRNFNEVIKVSRQLWDLAEINIPSASNTN